MHVVGICVSVLKKKKEKKEIRVDQPCRNITPLQNKESQQPLSSWAVKLRH